MLVLYIIKSSRKCGVWRPPAPPQHRRITPGYQIEMLRQAHQLYLPRLSCTCNPKRMSIKSTFCVTREPSACVWCALRLSCIRSSVWRTITSWLCHYVATRQVQSTSLADFWTHCEFPFYSTLLYRNQFVVKGRNFLYTAAKLPFFISKQSCVHQVQHQ